MSARLLSNSMVEEKMAWRISATATLRQFRLIQLYAGIRPVRGIKSLAQSRFGSHGACWIRANRCFRGRAIPVNIAVTVDTFPVIPEKIAAKEVISG